MGRVCVFSSYFCVSRIPSYVQYYLRQLRPHFDRLIFVTNKEKVLDEFSVTCLSELVDQVLLVKNEGYDFGMWKKVLADFDWGEVEELCLVNDSCFCLTPLDDVFSWVRATPQAVVGMVKSYQIEEHLQSWFMVFREGALRVVADHFRVTHFAALGYNEVVLNGEIALSQQLLRAGFGLNAVFSPTTNPKINPSFEEVYGLLVGQRALPLVKRKLFLGRPSKHMIRYCLERGYSSNPYTILKLMRERASAEALSFLSEVCLSKKVMCSYYWHLVRLTIKHQLKLLWKAFMSSRLPNS